RASLPTLRRARETDKAGSRVQRSATARQAAGTAPRPRQSAERSARTKPSACAVASSRRLIDAASGRVGAEEANLLAGRIDGFDLLAQIGGPADVQPEPIIRFDEVGHGLLVVRRPLRRDQLRSFVRMRDDPVGGRLIGSVKLRYRRAILL